MLRTICACLLAATAVLGWNVANTPPMGWNSWNFFGCSVTGQVLMDTADAVVRTGLARAGYQYVNSDDCWMLAQRDANGSQVANPDKFPNGFKAVADYIHSLGLKSGLYTAKGPNTCAGFAASCDHEYQDAAQWASWGIDYVKDDSCSTCPDRTDNDDYHMMWAAIQASGRPMVLTVEGDPTDSLITKGGYGNAKRVGHDINANWMSMVSLVDIGSGLWPFAHNSSNSTVGGWWNDLDMLEIGNLPDFDCDNDPEALARCQAHFTQWTIMKAPLIMGNNVSAIQPQTLAVLTNPDAIRVSQDPWGNQARRVAVLKPANSNLTAALADNNGVIAACDATRPTQTWFWNNHTENSVLSLYMEKCDPSNPDHQWSFEGGQLKNQGSGTCVDASANIDPAQLAACNPSSAYQQWSLKSSGHIESATGSCLDVYDFTGPDVEIYGCKPPGDQDSNQVFLYNATTKVIASASNQVHSGYCLVGSHGPGGGTLTTVDASGKTWCLADLFWAEGGWYGVECNPKTPPFTVTTRGPVVDGFVNVSFTGRQGYFGWNNQPGASGPWPHSRYLTSGGGVFTINLAAAQGSAGSTITAADHTGIINDDLVGGVTTGGDFCLDLVTGGMLEVWASQLSTGWAVSVFNRSPGSDSVEVQWSMFGESPSATFAVRDVWAGKDMGAFTGSYKTAVAAHATVYLILTPVA